MSKKHSATLIVAGGGTGGHVWAGVAIADEWKKQRGPDARVLFVGARGGLEEKIVPKAGYPLELLEVSALKGMGLKKRFQSFFKLPLSFWVSLKICLREKPHAVIGVGGYASGPMVLISSFFARSAILEQNSVPGFTNRMLGRFVRYIFCAFEETCSRFSSHKTAVTGNPIRITMTRMPKAGFPFTIFIFGGSQGALGMNTLVIDSLKYLKDLAPNLRWIHQTGEKDFERVDRAHREAETGAEVHRFIFDMPEKYRQASLVIARAGASTLSELAAVGRAAILVPLPTAADNHQEVNARIFEKSGAAIVKNQKTCSGAELAALLRDLIENSGKITAMEEAVTHFYRPTAAKEIVEKLISS